MLYELRVYEIAPGKQKALVDRFAEVTVGLWKKHGIRPMLFVEPVTGVSNQLVYLLEWDSLEERERRWDAFTSDSAWIAAKAETEKDGPLVPRFTNNIFRDVPKILESYRRLDAEPAS